MSDESLPDIPLMSDEEMEVRSIGVTSRPVPGDRLQPGNVLRTGDVVSVVRQLYGDEPEPDIECVIQNDVTVRSEDTVIHLCFRKALKTERLSYRAFQIMFLRSG